MKILVPDKNTRLAGAPAQSSRASEPPQRAQSSQALKAPTVGKDSRGQTVPRGAQPRVRAQTVPTASQRAAFARALARRNAERAAARMPNATLPSQTTVGPSAGQTGLGQVGTGGSSAGNAIGLFAEPAGALLPERSLSDLARMAANKRPLAESMAASTRAVPSSVANWTRPKRAVFAVGSGLAAAVLIGVLSFELLRTPHAAAEMPRSQAAHPQVFGETTTLVAKRQEEAPPPLPISPVPSSPQSAAAQSQAGILDPGTAPPDPPPRTPFAGPGPVEPPEAMHGRVPLGMVPPGFEPQPDSR
jgi:hypothetical protein